MGRFFFQLCSSRTHLFQITEDRLTAVRKIAEDCLTAV